MPYSITVERDSVCMGDDVNAPNTTTVFVNDDMHLSTAFSLIADKVAKVNDTHTIVWSVHVNNKKGKPLGMFEVDNMELSGVTLFVPDQTMKELSIKKLYCRYFCKSTLMQPDKDGRLCIPMYPECPTLGTKVMKYLKVLNKKDRS